MHEEFAPKGVEILAISVDERWRDLDAFRREIASLLEQAGD